MYRCLSFVRVGSPTGLSICIAMGALSGAVFGCSGEKNHPPAVGDCQPPLCGEVTDATLGSPGGSIGTGGAAVGGSSGAGGRSGSGGSAGGNGHSLSGAVAAYADAAFVRTTPFNGTGTISLTGSKTVPGTISGGKWSVSGAESSPSLWATLQATATPDAMETLEIVDGTQTTANVTFALRSTLDDIVSALSSTQSLRTDASHFVLTFVDSANKPVSGVKVQVSQSGATVAYDLGNNNAYADVSGNPPLGATQTRGTAIVFNYAAGTGPASVAIQYLASGATSGTSVDVRAVNNAVTFRTIAVK